MGGNYTGTIQNTEDPILKKLIIYNDKTKHFETDFYEDFVETEITEPKRFFEKKICLTQGLDESNCLPFIKKNKLFEAYEFDPNGSECKSFNFRPGSVIKNISEITDKELSDAIVSGKQCRYKLKFYPLTKEYNRSCCLNPDELCHPNWNNNFYTSHCDPFMKEYCKDNILNYPICNTWMKKIIKNSRVGNLVQLNKKCSEDLHLPECQLLYEYTLETDNKNYYEEALKTYCEKNQNDINCSCFLQKNNIDLKELEKLPGPKECFLDTCVGTPTRFLSEEQRKVQQSCKYVNCSINIDNLKINPSAELNLFNNCANRMNSMGELEENSENNFIEKFSNLGYFSMPMFLLIFLFILIIINFRSLNIFEKNNFLSNASIRQNKKVYQNR